MTRPVRRAVGAAAVGTGLLICLCAAHADDAPDSFTRAILDRPLHYALLGVGGLLAVEAAVWLFEAWVYCWSAQLVWRRALVTSLVANLASFLIGPLASYGIGGLVERIGGGGSAGSLPAILIVSAAVTLATEMPIVWAMNRKHPDWDRLLSAALICNVVSLPALWLALWMLITVLDVASIHPV